jgi:hypothetical protein
VPFSGFISWLSYGDALQFGIGTSTSVMHDVD